MFCDEILGGFAERNVSDIMEHVIICLNSEKE